MRATPFYQHIALRHAAEAWEAQAKIMEAREKWD